MGLPGGKKTKTGAWATDADVLEDLAAQGHALAAHHPRLAPALQAEVHLYRRAAQPTSTRDRAASTPPIHQAAAPTGRLASTDPNLQNIPIRTEEGRKIRKAFVAAAGHARCSRPTTRQIELRILAHIADIQALKEAFEDGLDIHAITAVRDVRRARRRA